MEWALFNQSWFAEIEILGVSDTGMMKEPLMSRFQLWSTTGETDLHASLGHSLFDEDWIVSFFVPSGIPVSLTLTLETCLGSNGISSCLGFPL